MITRQRQRLVIFVGKHRVRLEPCSEGRDFHARLTVHHQQSAAVRTQRLVELAHAVPDKFDTAVLARQAVKNLAVKHKDAIDTAGGSQRTRQRGVIVRAQIAAEPDKCGLFIHGRARDSCQ